jgi:hypothetical protein
MHAQLDALGLASGHFFRRLFCTHSGGGIEGVRLSNAGPVLRHTPEFEDFDATKQHQTH